MFRLTLQKQLNLILVGIFLVLVVFEYLYYSKSQELYAAVKVRGHTFRALQSLKSLAIALYHSESQKRGYLLTGDPVFREGLEETIGRMLPIREELAMVIRETPAMDDTHRIPYSDGLEAISEGFNQRIVLLRSMLGRPKSELLRDAPAEVRKGRAITKAISGMMMRIEEDMTARLDASNKVIEQKMEDLWWLGPLTIIPALMLVAFAYLQIRSTFLARDGIFE